MEIAEKLAIKCRDDSLYWKTFTKQNERLNTPITLITVSDTGGHHVGNMSKVIVIPGMPPMRDNFVTKKDIESFEHRSDVQLPILDGHVTMLIGHDSPLILTPYDIRMGG